MTDKSDSATGLGLTIQRTFDAPRERVFRAWADPEQLAAWWGPKDCRATLVEADVRAAGAWRTCIRHVADGTEYWCSGVYREVVPPDRLVLTFAWEEPPGSRGDESVITVTFADEHGKTRMTFHQAAFHSVEQRDEHVSGWDECFTDLAKYLSERRTRPNGG